jgi:hypothetical protein
MTLAAVFLAPANQVVVTSSSGHTYAVSGSTVVIPFPDAINVQLELLQIQGATSDRPVATPQGNIFGVGATSVPLRFFDTTLGEMIFNSNPGQSPTVWISSTGSVV